MEILITAIVFFIILSVLVLVHEAGHYFAAKKAGVRVDEFGFGLPPKIWGVQRGETEFTINALPIGGFVRLYGESPDGVSIKEQTGGSDHDRMFLSKSKKARAAILLAGVTANLVLGMIIFTIVYSVGLPQFDAQPKIASVQSGSPAEAAGLSEGQVVVAVNDSGQIGMAEFNQVIQDNKGQEVAITVQDPGGSEHEVSVTPRTDPPAGQGALGVQLEPGKIFIASEEEYPIWQAWYIGIKEALAFAWMIVASLGAMVLNIFSKGQVPSDVSGPIGIAAILGEARALGMVPVLWFAGIISINLAVINVLPFPALDGGRLVFVIIEAVTGKKVNADIERKVHTAGMIALLTLIALITFSDIHRLVFK